MFRASRNPTGQDCNVPRLLFDDPCGISGEGSAHQGKKMQAAGIDGVGPCVGLLKGLMPVMWASSHWRRR